MKDSAKKAIIQIFLYCNYYNYLNNSNQKIKPLIYTVQDMSKAEIRINRNPVEDFNDFNEEFMELMKSKIEEMFDEEGNSIESAPHPKQIVRFKCEQKVPVPSILRKFDQTKLSE